MRTRREMLVISAVLAWLCLPLAGQEGEPPSMPTQAELIEMAEPGPEHDLLAGYAGTWDVTVTMGSGPGAVVTEGRAENRMVVGNRFLQMEYSVRGPGGETDGLFNLGFDRRHGHFVMIAMDSHGTYSVTSKGEREGDDGPIRMRGVDDDPMMKAMGFTKEFIHVVHLRSPDEFVVEVWFVDTRTDERPESRFMDYTFKRAP